MPPAAGDSLFFIEVFGSNLCCVQIMIQHAWHPPWLRGTNPALEHHPDAQVAQRLFPLPSLFAFPHPPPFLVLPLLIFCASRFNLTPRAEFFRERAEQQLDRWASVGVPHRRSRTQKCKRAYGSCPTGLIVPLVMAALEQTFVHC